MMKGEMASLQSQVNRQKDLNTKNSDIIKKQSHLIDNLQRRVESFESQQCKYSY